jgi:iron complex outermembrane recepter protein
MRFNVAAFNYEIENQQVQFISLLAGGAVTFENAGSVEVQGFEFDALVQVFPSLVDDLILTVGAAFIDPKYASYPDGSGFDDSGLLTQNNDFSGNQVVRSAKESGSIGLSKTFGTAWGPIEIGGNWYHSSRYYYSAQNSPAAEEDPYDLLSARISFLYERWNLRTTVFGENIGDEEYSYSKFPTDFGVGDARAPKSVYGLRLGLSF